VGGFFRGEQDLAAAVLGFELEELEAFGGQLAAFTERWATTAASSPGSWRHRMTHRVSSFFFSSLASTASVGMRLGGVLQIRKVRLGRARSGVLLGRSRQHHGQGQQQESAAA